MWTRRPVSVEKLDCEVKWSRQTLQNYLKSVFHSGAQVWSPFPLVEIQNTVKAFTFQMTGAKTRQSAFSKWGRLIFHKGEHFHLWAISQRPRSPLHCSAHLFIFWPSFHFCMWMGECLAWCAKCASKVTLLKCELYRSFICNIRCNI